LFNFSDPSVQRKWVLFISPLAAMLLGVIVTKAPFVADLHLTGDQIAAFMVSFLVLAAGWIHQSGTNSGQKAVAAATIQAAQISAGVAPAPPLAPKTV
jgi:hypothetical protein